MAQYFRYFWEPITSKLGGKSAKSAAKHQQEVITSASNWSAITANLRDLKQFNGKYSIAGDSFITQPFLMPQFQCKPLFKDNQSLDVYDIIKPHNNTSEPSLMVFALKEQATKDVHLYERYWRENVPSHLKDRSFHFYITENGLVSPFESFIRRSLRKRFATSAAELQGDADEMNGDRVFTRFGSGFQSVRMTMGMRNVMVPWVYLVSGDGHVVWQCHSTPTADELQSMVRLASKLSPSTDKSTKNVYA